MLRQAGAGVLCTVLCLAVVVDRTPTVLLQKQPALACGRGGPCPDGPAFIRKSGLTSAAEVAWSKGFPVENAADKAPTVMLKQIDGGMYYEPRGVQELPQKNPLQATSLPPIPKPYGRKPRTFKNTPYFHAKAPTQMLWNAQKTRPYNPMTHSEHDAFLMHEGHDQQRMVNTQISQWEKQADYNPAGTDY